MDSRTGGEFLAKIEKLERATSDRKLWIAMVAYVLKGRSHKENLLELFVNREIVFCS